MLFGIIGWVLVGLVVGFVATKFVNLRGDEPLIGILAGLAGAIVGGVLFAVISGRGVQAWDVWALLCAAAGAAVGAAGYHLIRSRSISHDSQTVRRSY